MGLGRAVKVMSLALAVGVSLVRAAEPGPIFGADTTSAGSAADSLAAAPADSLAAVLGDSLAAAPGDPPTVAPGDSSAAVTAGVAVSADLPCPRLRPRPWAHAGVPLKTPFQFFRPWTLRPAPGRDGLRVGSASPPHGEAERRSVRSSP